MTNAERKLLLMVAEDMRRLWDEYAFVVCSGSSDAWKEQYDETIHKVKYEIRDVEQLEREINLLKEKGAG